MKREILFPQLSTKIESGTIVEWHAAIGDEIKEGEVLYEVETSKTISDVEAPFSGKLIEIKAQAGDEVKVDDVIAIVESD
jgi:pyruvate/2-oxoglutarate dehydrogenase complex dihydrolipoamide acyltransferase (E2) component